MSKKILVSAIPYLVLAALAVGIALLVQTRPQPAEAQQTAAFDHTNCQYPDRWTNPPNGCDNSDPAVPECIKEFSTKEGEEACIARFVAQHEKPVKPKPAQPQAVHYGGK